MKKKFSAIAALLAVAVLLSIFTVSVFATEGTTEPEETPAVEDAVTTPSDAEETTPTSTTTKAPTTTAGSTNKNTGPTLLEIVIPLAILVVIIVVLVVVFFGLPKYRTKTLEFCRSIKSECKKVAWYSWKNTRKGTIVVVVCVVVLAVVIGLLDWLFFTVIDAIPGLF